MAVAGRTEAPGAVHPGLIAAIDSDSPRRVELRVLHVEGFDALVIEVDEGGVIELLQQEVARVVVDAGPRMPADDIDEPFERGAVVDVFPGWIS